MREALLDVLPLAIAIALSPFPIVPMVLLLLTDRARATAGGFLAGWAVGLIAATTAFVFVAELLDRSGDPAPWTAWVRVVLGLVLVGLSLRQWRGRHDERPTPTWMTALDQASPGSAARLGLLLSAANPKVLVLAAAAGATIGTLDLDTTSIAVSIVAFVALASLGVATPYVLFLLRGERMAGRLRSARDWLLANNAAVTSIVVGIIGVVLIIKGIQGL